MATMKKTPPPQFSRVTGKRLNALIKGAQAKGLLKATQNAKPGKTNRSVKNLPKAPKPFVPSYGNLKNFGGKGWGP